MYEVSTQLIWSADADSVLSTQAARHLGRAP
jgi:hypothetical protein